MKFTITGQNRIIRFGVLLWLACIGFSLFAHSAFAGGVSRTFSHPQKVTLNVFDNNTVTGPESITVTASSRDTRSLCVKALKVRANVTRRQNSSFGINKEVTVRDSRGLCSFTRSISIPVWEIANKSRWGSGSTREEVWSSLNRACQDYAKISDIYKETYDIKVYNYNKRRISTPWRSNYSPSSTPFELKVRCVSTPPNRDERHELEIHQSWLYDIDRGVRPSFPERETADLLFSGYGQHGLWAQNGAMIAMVSDRESCASPPYSIDPISPHLISNDVASYLCIRTNQGNNLVLEINSRDFDSFNVRYSPPGQAPPPVSNRRTTSQKAVNIRGRVPPVSRTPKVKVTNPRR